MQSKNNAQKQKTDSPSIGNVQQTSKPHVEGNPSYVDPNSAGGQQMQASQHLDKGGHNAPPEGQGDDQPVKKVQTKFHSSSLREFYDSSNLTAILTKGLEELGRTRPANPIRFLGNFLLEHDPEK